MTRKNLAYFDGTYGYLTVVDDYESYEVTTLRASIGSYIRSDDRNTYPQLCVGGRWRGNTLTWADEPADFARHFASDCNARLFKTRAGYEKARRAALANNPEGEYA